MEKDKKELWVCGPWRRLMQGCHTQFLFALSVTPQCDVSNDESESARNGFMCSCVRISFVVKT